MTFSVPSSATPSSSLVISMPTEPATLRIASRRSAGKR